LKNNLHHEPKQWIQTLAIETETTISQLPEKEQTYIRHLAANIQKLIIEQDTLRERRKTTHAKWELIEWNTMYVCMYVCMYNGMYV
jgi:hypothetical protein